MNGQVLNFDIAANSGVITGADGNRYNFTGADWMDANNPARGMGVDFDTDGNNAVNIYGDAPAPVPQPAPAAAPAYAAPAAAAPAVSRQLPRMLFSLQPYEQILSEASDRGNRTLITTHRLIGQSSEFFGLIKDETYIPLENIDSVQQGRTISKKWLIIGILTIPFFVGILITAFVWFFTRKDLLTFRSGSGGTIEMASGANRLTGFVDTIESARQARVG